MLLGWFPDYSLKMVASRFFAILSSARIMKMKSEARNYYELTSVAMCANADTKWIQRLQGYHYDKFKVPNPMPAKAVAAKIISLMGG